MVATVYHYAVSKTTPICTESVKLGTHSFKQPKNEFSKFSKSWGLRYHSFRYHKPCLTNSSIVTTTTATIRLFKPSAASNHLLNNHILVGNNNLFQICHINLLFSFSSTNFDLQDTSHPLAFFVAFCVTQVLLHTLVCTHLQKRLCVSLSI